MTASFPVRARTPRWLAAAAGSVLAALLLAQPSAAQIDVGDTPKFTWAEPLIDGLGTTKLEELRGKLVWIEFWGTY